MFRRPQSHYGRSPEPETPYQRARQVWDERIGAVAVAGRRVWTLALVEGGVIAVLSLALVWTNARGSVTPWVVEVDRFGEARAVGPAIADYQAPDYMIAERLERFIKQVRAVPADPVVLRTDLLAAYGFATSNGAKVITAYVDEAAPFALVGKSQVSLDVSSVVRASPTSFRIAWSERHYQDGAQVAVERWSAIVTLVKLPKPTKARLKTNPLNVAVDAIDWSKEMAP
ncbi:MAG: conjugal transfer protein TrbF [Caulobacter sp.]|nr:conjugal transfer protein TrbF [Caulobacter sp.]